jgi:G3E family GTPase
MGSKVAVIVNEIGDVDIDGEFVKGSGLYSKRLLGGCICCSLGNDLVSTIKSVIEEYDPEVLFVEPTGVALPSQVRDYFVQASYILAGLEFSPVVTLVDGSRFKFLLREFRPFFTKQMRDADILVVTKIDKLDKKFELPLIVSALREIHPRARIIGTSTVTGQ